jgi:hypothetical protein
MVIPCSCFGSDKLARDAKDKEHAMSQKLSASIALIGIDIGKSAYHVVATMSAAPSCCDKSGRAASINWPLVSSDETLMISWSRCLRTHF